MGTAAATRRRVALVALVLAAGTASIAQEGTAPRVLATNSGPKHREVVALKYFPIPFNNLMAGWSSGEMASLQLENGAWPAKELVHRRWSRRFEDPGFAGRVVELVGAPVAFYQRDRDATGGHILGSQSSLSVGPSVDVASRRGPAKDRDRDLVAVLDGEGIGLRAEGTGRFAGTHLDGTVFTLDVETLPTTLCGIPGTRRFVAGGLAGDLSIIEAPTKEHPVPTLIVHREKMLGYPPVDALAASADGKLCAVSHGVHARVKLYGFKAAADDFGEMIAFFKEDSPALSLAFDGEGKRLFVGHADGTVRCLEVPDLKPGEPGSLKQAASWSTGKDAVRALAVLPGGDLATGDDGGRVTRWTGTTGKAAWEYRPPAPAK